MGHLRYDHDKYVICIVVDGLIELRAIQAVLDEEHYQQIGPAGEPEAYTFGSIGKHNVVIAQRNHGWLKHKLAGTSMSMSQLYLSVKLRLFIGLASALADPDHGQDIRLGDVVFDIPLGGPDMKTTSSFLKARLHSPDVPENILRMLQAMRNALWAAEKPFVLHNFQSAQKGSWVRVKGNEGIVWTKPEADILFQSSYTHLGPGSCVHCDHSRLVKRNVRPTESPLVHRGLIASAPSKVFHAEVRDSLAKEIEQEIGAPCLCIGSDVEELTQIMPCFIVNGICDYSDSHRNNEWRPYAALAAAFHAKNLINEHMTTQWEEETWAGSLKITDVNFSDNPAMEGPSNQYFEGNSVIDVQQEDVCKELLELGHSIQDASILMEMAFTRSLWSIPYKTNRTMLPAAKLHLPHHCERCAHSWPSEPDLENRKTSISSATLNTSPTSVMPSSDKDSLLQVFEEYCGLAGLFPPFPDRITKLGEGVLNGPSSGIISVGNVEIYTDDNAQSVVNAIKETLTGLLSLCSWTQMRSICCDSFTMVVLGMDNNTLELKNVSFGIIRDLNDAVNSYKVHQEPSIHLKSQINNFLKYLNIRQDSFLSTSREIFLHKFYLVMQIMCLGLLSYSRAHIGPLQTSLVEQSLHTFHMLGSKNLPNQITVTASLAKLSCLDGMIKSPLLVLHSSSITIDPNMAYDLSATPEDLIDTWGPGSFVLSSHVSIIAIDIGGGIIRQPQDSRDFHWYRQVDSSNFLSTRTFNKNTIIRIGMVATSVTGCPFKEKESFNISNEHLYNLGPSPAFWLSAERQLGLQGGQYGVLQFNNTWVKRDEITVKAHYLDKICNTISLPFLESSWGLQVSLCTGVARRVTLLDLLADVMDIYVKACLGFPAKDWYDLTNKYNITQQFRGRNKISLWFDSLPPHLQKLTVEVIHYVLHVMRPTGIDRTGENLVVAWASGKDPFRCIHVSCAGSNSWTRMLADSEDCATFAYMTAACVQTSRHRCRRTAVLEWRRTVPSCQTHVCRQLLSDAHSSTPAAGVWRLDDSPSYLIGKPETRLVAKLLQPVRAGSETWLNVYQTKLPPSFLKKIQRMQRIRERQSEDGMGHEVLISASDSK